MNSLKNIFLQHFKTKSVFQDYFKPVLFSTLRLLQDYFNLLQDCFKTTSNKLLMAKAGGVPEKKMWVPVNTSWD